MREVEVEVPRTQPGAPEWGSATNVGSNLRSRPEILESKRMIQMLLDPDGSTRTDSSKKGCRCPKQDAPKRTTRAPMAFPP